MFHYYLMLIVGVCIPVFWLFTALGLRLLTPPPKRAPGAAMLIAIALGLYAGVALYEWHADSITWESSITWRFAALVLMVLYLYTLASVHAAYTAVELGHHVLYYHVLVAARHALYIQVIALQLILVALVWVVSLAHSLIIFV